MNSARDFEVETPIEKMIKTYSDFSKDHIFPRFNQVDDEVSFHHDEGYFNDTINWCLFAEIIEAETIIRLRLVCSDENKRDFVVAFYPGQGVPVDPRPYKVGHTIAILNAKSKTFLDQTDGIRVEKLETCRAFPIKLADLYLLNTELIKYTRGIDERKGTQQCHACDKKGQKLKKCGGCGYYYYCDAACQKTAWEAKGHKKACKVLKNPNMKMLLNLGIATETVQFKD
ncbi:hypothetical protein CORC01_03581 [Colletotrichum orchidophilum]|uniref:MYND-type domain-containing protein n=1 Tax=Colletotrichum orchidophilum TaxID=1209926 RepID=A0A1G4BHY1_9PEZI|nr:uncharacterized protein CORC01_03581 [Colletotrichum orchidophilum]OHF01014.1 hypothetical protein CORC01_03581 [Colletotrichum orchidophilum]